jgi:hypothetical protein
MNVTHFNLPTAPQDVVFPYVPQLIATSAMWLVVALVVCYAAYDTWKARSPVAPLLILGSAIAYLNEPFVDVMGLVLHPRIGQWVALETLGPVPWWGLAIYIIYFGGLTLGKLRIAQKGLMTRKGFWIGTCTFFVVNIVAEVPLIQSGMYLYYNDPPFLFFGLPLYWLVINASGPLMCVALLLRAPQLFTGWRTPLIALLPMTTDAMGSIGAGWPIFTALNTPGIAEPIKYGAALLTVGIGLLLMDGLSRLICSEGRQAESEKALETSTAAIKLARS